VLSELAPEGIHEDAKSLLLQAGYQAVPDQSLPEERIDALLARIGLEMAVEPRSFPRGAEQREQALRERADEQQPVASLGRGDARRR